MKIAWLLTALIALLGSVLIFESSESFRQMSHVIETMRNQIQNQNEQLILAQTQLKAVSQELDDLKQTQTSTKSSSIQSDVQEALRLEREKQVAERDELVRQTKMKELIKAEKERIQKTQLHIENAKRRIDAEEKAIDFEILKAIVENSVQKSLNAKALNDAANAPLKGVDRYGESTFDPATMTSSVAHKDGANSTNAMSRKIALAEERKKIAVQQHTLDEDKQKLSKSIALYKQQQQEISRSSNQVSPVANR